MKKSIFLLLFLFSTLLISESYAQMSGKMDFNEITKSIAQNKMNKESFLRTEQTVFGNIVDPDKYYLGPGDILNYQVLPAMFQDELLIISPDNMIHIPNYGIELNIEGMSLSDVKDKIKSKINEINKNHTLSISLFKPRQCFVTIEGNVSFPGTYTIPSSYRISSAIKMANQLYSERQIPVNVMRDLTDKKEYENIENQLLSGSGIPSEIISSERNVIVLHTNGAAEIADLARAQIRDDIDYDPYIKEGDNIFVSYDKQNIEQIIISGEVIRPAVLEFKSGDKLSDLIKFGFGFTDKADLNNIIFIDPNTGEEALIKVSNELVLLSQDQDLSNGALVIVGKKQSKAKINSGVVVVNGEVQHPGTYSIKPGETTIRSIIEKAGGFTEDAYLPLARINRKYDDYNLNRSKYLESSFQNSNLTLEDTLRFNINFRNKMPIASCDFVELYSKKNSSQDVLLLNGDVITIPASPKQVYVFGQIKNPGYVGFESGHTAAWYIVRTGGFTEAADIDRVKIIRGKNKIWVDADDEVVIFDGDEIYVTMPPDVPTYVEIQKYSMYVQVVVALVTLANVVMFIYLNRKNF